MNTKDEFLEDGVTPNPDYIKPEEKTPEQKDSEMLEKLVAERLEKELADIKKKLDASYAARDAANKKAAELELKEREAEKAKLESEGKYKELYEIKLQEERDARAQEKARNDALEARNTELSRDVSVRDALKGYSFRNETASEMAYKEVITQLIRNDKGEWVHRTGISIREFAAQFAKDEAQSFLFKPKSNSGAGSTNNSGNGNPDPKQGKSLFGLTQAEVLKMAENGTLPQRKY